MKTLKDMFEVYKPKSPDEQKFVDKHVTIKHKDRNEVNGKANGDDVFKATNIKTIDREKTRHGYSVGADEKVYEENEFVNEDDFLPENFADEYHVLYVNKKPSTKYSNPNDAKKDMEQISKKHPDAELKLKRVTTTVSEEIVDEGILDFMKKKKPKITVGKATRVADLPDGEKPFQKIMAARENQKKLTKEDIINRTIEKYMPEVADIKPLTMEERLAKKLEGLSESHIALLFSLFTNLNEDNQMKMIEACADRDGINDLIDFALENKGD
jgi:hypothetical protein